MRLGLKSHSHSGTYIYTKRDKWVIIQNRFIGVWAAWL